MNQKILGIDPGTGRLGWAIVAGDRHRQKLIAYGCIETPARTLQSQRLLTIGEKLEAIINEHEPDGASVEALFFARNTTTAMSVAEARGVILFCLEKAGIPAFTYTPMQIKQGVTGYGKADKRQVQTMVKTLLRLKAIPRPDDAADAVAAALTHLMMAQFT